jgi:hypothetical protein
MRTYQQRPPWICIASAYKRFETGARLLNRDANSGSLLNKSLCLLGGVDHLLEQENLTAVPQQGRMVGADDVTHSQIPDPLDDL